MLVLNFQQIPMKLHIHSIINFIKFGMINQALWFVFCFSETKSEFKRDISQMVHCWGKVYM